MSGQENPLPVENLDQTLLRLRKELSSTLTESTKLSKELTSITTALASIPGDIVEAGNDTESINVLKSMQQRAEERLPVVKETLENLKTATLNLRGEISKVEQDTKEALSDKKVPEKKKVPTKDPASKKPKVKPTNLSDAFNSAAQGADPVIDPLPDPTQPQNPKASPKTQSKGPTPPTGAPKPPTPNAPEKIKWIDKEFIKRSRGNITGLETLLEDRKQRLLTPSIADEERSLVEQEIKVVEGHISCLKEIIDITVDNKPYVYAKPLPKIDFNTRKRESTSGWRDRRYLANVKNDLEGLLGSIEELREQLSKADITQKPRMEKEIAVRKLYVEKLSSLLDEALKTPKIKKVVVNTNPAPTPTPPTPSPTANSGHNAPANVQSSATNTNMATPEDFADKALNTAGFAKYAAEVGDTKGFSTEELQESLAKEDDPGKLLFETYKNMEVFKNDLKKLFREDAAGIIQYEDQDFESIEKYMEANRVANPEKIVELMRNMEQVRKDQKEIKEKEAKIAELTKKREKQINEYVKEKKEEYQKGIDEGAKNFLNKQNNTRWLNVMNMGNWFGKGYWKESSAKAALEGEIAKLGTDGEALATRAGVTKELDAEIAIVNDEKSDINRRFLGIKSSLLQHADYSKEIHVAARKRVTEEINKMLSNAANNGLSDIDSEQKRLSRINELRDSNLSFAYLSGKESDDFQKLLDQQAEEIAKREIDKALGEINLDAGNQYTQLEKSLVKLVNREQLGSKAGPETKNFIVDTLKTKLGKLEKFSRGQALLLSHLIKKVEAAKI